MSERPLVAVVDDDISVREAVPDLLRLAGFAVQAFASAEAFLTADVAAATDCLVLDVGLPGMSGPDLQQELIRRGTRVPIVFITANGDQSLQPRLLAAGAAACLFKPFNDTTLIEAVTAALGTRHAMTTAFHENVIRQPYTVSSLIATRGVEAISMPDVTGVVFVVDDDLSVREALEPLLKDAGWHPQMFESAQGFLDQPRATGPSCLVLDVTLPGLNGLELQRRLSDRPEMPIIFITGYGDVPMSVQAIKAGAVEFLTKPFKDEVLLEAIRGAIEHSREALRRESAMRVLRDSYASLTPREREVMALVASGLLNKQVGGELSISEITVKAHRGQVMRKMKADSLADLVTMAASLGLKSTATH